MSLVASLRDYVDALVHPSARQDALVAARHRAFIASRLLGGLIALAAFPIYLVLRGAPNTIEVAVFGWFIVPVAIAYFLSHTGRYEAAHILSAAALAGLVAAVALATGGIGSFAAVWFVVVPLEASLAASRRVVAWASLIALAAASTVFAAGTLGLVHGASAIQHVDTLVALGIVSAGLYAAGLALGAESFARVASRRLNDEEQRYRLLTRNMSDVISRHGRAGTVEFISPAAEAVFGVAPKALLGHGLFDRVHVGDRPAFLKALADAATSGAVQSVEFRIRRETSGEAGPMPHFVWVEMRCRPLDEARERDAAEHGVVAVMRDVSDRKTQEQALEEAHADAEQANIAKSQFLATMSHELRTPLNAIIGFSEMLTQEQALNLDAPRRIDYARLINESGHHLLSVVNGILDVTKIESGKFEITPEPFAPAPVISRCCELLALKARESGIELSTHLPDALPEINADKRALKQIVLNLVSNAIKFTEPTGKVEVAVYPRGAFMVLTVEDTGIGIRDEDLPHLGNPFFQGRSSYDRRYDGTGLGLSVVKGLITLHGGEFEIRSRLGLGTCVTVRLPLDCDAARRDEMLSKIATLPVFDDESVQTRMKKRA